MTEEDEEFNRVEREAKQRMEAVSAALDKKAENARALGLDYEPVCNKDPQGCWNVRCQLGKKCKNTPAQQEPKIDIYRSFEQWKSGNVLEHGVPRTEHYSEAQLDLVEMGWNYGYDAGRAVEQALDKMAENERELGIQMEPEQLKPADGQLVWVALAFIAFMLTLLTIRSCV